MALEQGDPRQAQALYAESLQAFAELGQMRDAANVLDELAGSAAGLAQWERALKLAGAAAALRQRFGAPPSAAAKAKLETSLDPARRSLGGAATTAWMQGWAMSLEEAIRFAAA